MRPGCGRRGVVPGRRATGVDSASGAIGKAGVVLLSQAYMEGLARQKTLKLRGRRTQGTWSGFAEGCSRSPAGVEDLAASDGGAVGFGRW